MTLWFPVALLHSLPMAIPLRRNAVDPPPREKANAVLLVGRFWKQNLPMTHSLRQATRTNSCFVDIRLFNVIYPSLFYPTLSSPTRACEVLSNHTFDSCELKRYTRKEMIAREEPKPIRLNRRDFRPSV
jgi:hypothetical protein